jgi:O-antigen/teichoic acid export membrane protein
VFTKVRKLAGQSLIYTVGDMLNLGLAFLLIPLYTAYLTPADYGILAIATTLGSVLGVLYLQSLEATLSRFYYDYSDDDSRRGYYGTVWILMIGSGLAASLLIEAIGQPLSHFVFKDIPFVPYIRLVVWITFINNSSFLLLPALLRVQEKPGTFVALSLTSFLVNTALIIYFVVGEQRGALGNLEGRFLASLLLAVPVTILYLRQAKLHWSWPQAKASLQFALPLTPHLLSLWILNLSDRMVLQQYVSLNDVGIYSFGYQFASVLNLIVYSLASAMGPFFFKTAGQPQGPTILSRVSTYYWLITMVLGVGLAAIARDALIVITSRPAYHIAYQVVPWVVLGFIMRTFYLIFSSSLYYAKQVKSLAIVTVVSGLLNVGLNLLFVPQYGYMAAAVNTFIAYAFQSVIMYFMAQRAYTMPYEYIRIAKMSAVGIGIYFVAVALPIFPVWINLIVKVGVVASYPIWLTLIGFWTVDEIALLRRTVQRVATSFQKYGFGSTR